MMRVQSSSGLRPSYVLRAIVRWLCGVSFMIYGFAKLNGAHLRRRFGPGLRAAPRATR